MSGHHLGRTGGQRLARPDAVAMNSSGEDAIRIGEPGPLTYVAAANVSNRRWASGDRAVGRRDGLLAGGEVLLGGVGVVPGGLDVDDRLVTALPAGSAGCARSCSFLVGVGDVGVSAARLSGEFPGLAVATPGVPTTRATVNNGERP